MESQSQRPKGGGGGMEDCKNEAHIINIFRSHLECGLLEKKNSCRSWALA